MTNGVIALIIYRTSIPTDLSDLDALSVILGQEIDGPPEDLFRNLYNAFWLERNATGGFLGCVRKGISFGKHQTGRLVSFTRVLCIQTTFICVKSKTFTNFCVEI